MRALASLRQPSHLLLGAPVQPGGYLKLKELGLGDCVEGIDAVKVGALPGGPVTLLLAVEQLFPMSGGTLTSLQAAALGWALCRALC